MAYTVPNTFSNGTVINSEEITENNDALRNYINGGVSASDISTLTPWVEAKHIMKGLYQPITNQYEMESGLSAGSPVFPFYHPGYFGSQFHKKGGSGRADVPNTHVDFYLVRDATVFFYYTISPRVLAPLDTSSPTNCLISLNVDGSTINTSQNAFTEQIEVNNSGGADEPIVSRYRRRTYSYQYVCEMTAGDHTIKLVGQSGATSVPLKFYTYSLQAFY